MLVSHLGVSVAVLRGEDEAGQVAGQIQTSEVPDQVPVDDGMMVDHVGLRDHRVALVLQQALQLLPQHQWAQVGNRHRLGVVEPPVHTQWILLVDRNDRGEISYWHDQVGGDALLLSSS